MFLTCDFQIQNNDYFEFGNHMLRNIHNDYFEFIFFFFPKKSCPRRHALPVQQWL